MKTRIIIAAIALLASSQTYAQMGKPSFGLRAGVNFQNLNGKDANDDRLENSLKVGFNAGVTADIPVADELFIQPGVLYSTKGAKVDVGNDNAKVNIGYIEIPINLLYKPLLGQGHLLMGFGPYVAFGVNGKVSGGGFEDDIKFDSEVTAADYFANPFILKRFDAGANLLFGYEFTQRLSAQLNAQLGLVNINPKISGAGSDPGTLKNTGFGVSLGYKL